ncbi:MAG: hypothetical protein ACON45_07690 [Paracoccaceae bacterium]
MKKHAHSEGASRRINTIPEVGTVSAVPFEVVIALEEQRELFCINLLRETNRDSR